MKKSVRLVAILVFFVFQGCDQVSDMNPSGDTVNGEDENEAVSLSVSLPSSIQEYETIGITVDAIDAQGMQAKTFSGTVEIIVSGGTFSVSAVELVEGTGFAEGYFDRAGRTVLTATSTELQDKAEFNVDPPSWERKPAKGWVFSGVVDEPNHWAFGGFWGGSVVTETPDNWVGFFHTSDAGDGFAKHVNALARATSSDRGATWTLDESPLLSESGSASVYVSESTGEWVMWRQLADDERTVAREISIDEGRTWTTTGCQVKFEASAWNAGAIRSVDAVESGNGQVSLWFAGSTSGESARSVLGRIRGNCEQGWSKPSIVIEAGEVGSWNEWEVFSPHVWRENGTWKLLAAGRVSSSSSSLVGYWTSDDGEQWVEVEGNPLLEKLSGSSAWDSRGIIAPFIANPGDDAPTLFLSGIPQDLRPRVVRLRP